MKKSKTYIQLQELPRTEGTAEVRNNNSKYRILRAPSRYDFFNHPATIISGSIGITVTTAAACYWMACQFLETTAINSYMITTLGLYPMQAIILLTAVVAIIATLSILIKLNFESGPKRPKIESF